MTPAPTAQSATTKAAKAAQAAPTAPKPPASPQADAARWYALRVFGNRITQIKDELEQRGARTYMAVKTVREQRNGRLVTREVQLAPSLLFACCTLSELLAFKKSHNDHLMLYRRADRAEPAPIPEAQMRLFILVTSATEGQDVDLLGLDRQVLDFHPGERVRVIEGPFKGAEGVVKRIKRDRKLLVSIEGVVVVAVSNIPAAFLERIAPAHGPAATAAPANATETTETT